jgi:hypothetical protein
MRELCTSLKFAQNWAFLDRYLPFADKFERKNVQLLKGAVELFSDD